MKKLLIVLVALLILGAIAVGVRTLGARDQTDKVDKKDAAELVKKDDDATEGIEAGDRPEPGTYSYTGSGRESVSVLGGSEHVFPEEIAFVVQLDPENACEWTSNVIYVKQHVEERRYCSEGGNVTDLGFTRETEFFNQRQKTVYECGEDALRRKDAAAEGDTWSWTCSEGDKSTSKYTAKMLATETLTIGGEKVETAHTRVTSKQTGETRGTDTAEFWLDEKGLIVKFSTDLKVKTKSILGETEFIEKTEYELMSLVPDGE
ncbi:MAG: hypothetical protein ABI200_08050 [Gaiellales bacterium]